MGCKFSKNGNNCPSAMSRIQAPLQAALSPAQWIPGTRLYDLSLSLSRSLARSFSRSLALYLLVLLRIRIAFFHLTIIIINDVRQ